MPALHDSQENLNPQPFHGMTDEEIVALAQQGNADALVHLLESFKSLVRIKARGYFLIGADYEDIVQEGMIGLYKAIRDCGPLCQAANHHRHQDSHQAETHPA